MALAGTMQPTRASGIARRARVLARRLGAALLILSASEVLFGDGAGPEQTGTAAADDLAPTAALETPDPDLQSLCQIIRRYGQPFILEARVNWCPQL